MTYLFKIFLRLCAGWMILLAGTAQAQQQNFISLHQAPLVYNTSINVDGSGNSSYVTTPPLYGFKNQFAPLGVSGCVIGYPEYRSMCLSVDGGFGFNFDGYSYQRSFKVYVPGGTTFFSLSGFLPQSSEYAVAVKMDAPPARSTPLSPAEYQATLQQQNLNVDFGRLLSGEERLMAHNGGGSVSLSGVARLDGNPLATGHWLYVQVLNGGGIDNLRGTYEVNRPAYKTWYDNAVAANLFGADGDPTVGGGPVVPPALQGISLSVSSWTTGSGSAPTLTLSATPNGAPLPGNCSVSPSGVLNIGPVTGSTAAVTINAAAAEALAQSRNDFVINCAGKTASFTVIKGNPNVPGPVVATATVRELQQSPDSPVVLMLDITHPATEISPTAIVSYYVGGLVPAHQFGMTGYDDVVFFLKNFSAPGVNPALYGWALLFKNQSLDSVAFEQNRPLRAASQALQIPLIFKKQEFKDLGARMRFGYTLTDGQFKVMDVIWNPAN